MATESSHATAIAELEASQLRQDHPKFRCGDTVRVHYRVIEGEKQRIQVFQGIVIKQHRRGARSTFTVRKVSFGTGVERIFPFHSPRIDKVEIVSRGVVRRSRLYYLRELSGKAARVRDVEDRKGSGARVTEPKGTSKPKSAENGVSAEASD